MMTHFGWVFISSQKGNENPIYFHCKYFWTWWTCLNYVKWKTKHWNNKLRPNKVRDSGELPYLTQSSSISTCNTKSSLYWCVQDDVTHSYSEPTAVSWACLLISAISACGGILQLAIWMCACADEQHAVIEDADSRGDLCVLNGVHYGTLTEFAKPLHTVPHLNYSPCIASIWCHTMVMSGIAEKLFTNRSSNC